jgi:hypothetical protein
VLTLSPAAEGTGGNLVPELAALLAAELLALLAGQELLVLVHLGLALLLLGEVDLRHALDGRVLHGLGAHRVEDVLHVLVGDGAARLRRPGLLRLLGLLDALPLQLLLLPLQLLLLLLLLCPERRLLLVHTRPHTARGARQCGCRRQGRSQRVRLLAADGAGVDGRVQVQPGIG